VRTAVHRGFLYIFAPAKTYRIKLGTTAYAKPDGADMVQLSIRPKAVAVTNDDRLLYTDLNGIWEMEQGDSYKAYTWQRTLSFGQPLSPGACRASFASGHLTMTDQVKLAGPGGVAHHPCRQE
jgi:hypothetical protein